MKVALVHDYLNEFGGAERVLEALAELYPEAPIYTAFYAQHSQAYERFKDKQIITSWGQQIPGFKTKLHSPLRFLAPLIWESFNFDQYEVVISSASWYITKGIITRPETLHICYCHTPPRYLYGYPTSVEWQKWWPVKAYASLINKGLREFDYLAAQRVDYFVANSRNVQQRIEKYYRRESEVIYPPVQLQATSYKLQAKKDYYLIISRLVGGKGIEMAITVANKLKLPLKIVGCGAGWSKAEQRLRELGGPTVEFLGFVADQKLAELYTGAKAFLALAYDEDFGITPVEAMMAGTPVIAFKGGGYKETVIEGKTGILFNDYSVEGLSAAIEAFKLQASGFDERLIRKHAQKFSKKRFLSEIMRFVEEKYAAKTDHL